MSEQQSALISVKSFLKRCYEIGNTPIWELGNVRSVQPVANSPKPITKETPKRSAARESASNIVFNLDGIIQAGTQSKFSINGEDFDISNDTWIVGVIRLGAAARVRGVFKPGGPKIATKVVML